ncbi:MAG: hypothetical protein LKJ22_07510 [Liquorilactobacillus nagelii]|jgi:ATP-dependent Clp protease ATP-binding subunit ClpA|uniref:hypothetical protein n=1 Tax=Liquorilactobacillus nagelii TaxID=82688 RepID=UPI00242CE11C|nr:hypothetical protein [Liquorilactobacillus nagelii]MCI1921760.1 hypothetical protein [Liquorilactobacillus nagelii]MCI1976710.1 hypothetical protein [Liquorilactobacillus nagelii]
MTTVTGKRAELLTEWIEKINAITKTKDDAQTARDEAQAKYDSLRLQLDDKPTQTLAAQVTSQGLVLDSLKQKATAAENDYQDFIDTQQTNIRSAAEKIAKQEIYENEKIKAKEAELADILQKIIEANDEITQLYAAIFNGAKTDVKPLEQAIYHAKDPSYPNYNMWNHIPGIQRDILGQLESLLKYTKKWAGTDK